MHDKSIEFLFSTLVPCNNAEEAEKCIKKSSQEYEIFMKRVNEILESYDEMEKK